MASAEEQLRAAMRKRGFSEEDIRSAEQNISDRLEGYNTGRRTYDAAGKYAEGKAQGRSASLPSIGIRRTDEQVRQSMGIHTGFEGLLNLLPQAKVKRLRLLGF